MNSFNQIGQQFINFFDKIKEFSFASWLLTIMVGLYGAYIDMIGFPSQAIKFIIMLVIFDFITRILAEVVKANGFILAFKTKGISSRKFFSGFFVKCVSYTIILAIAHQAVLTPELPFKDFIASTIYTGLIIYDIISVLENLSEVGFNPASGLLKIFKKKASDFEQTGTEAITTIVNNVVQETVSGVAETSTVVENSSNSDVSNETTLVPKSNY